MMNITVSVSLSPSRLPLLPLNERTNGTCRVLHIHRTCPRCTRHSRTRTCGGTSCGPILVHLGTADRACGTPWKALFIGKILYCGDYRRTNVTCTVYGILRSTRRYLRLTRLLPRCFGVSQKRDGRRTAPYVTCRFPPLVYETDVVLVTKRGSTLFCWLLACKWLFSDCKPHWDPLSSCRNAYVVQYNPITD